MNKALIAIDRSKSFRVYLTISTDLVQEAAKIHDTTPLASAGLGQSADRRRADGHHAQE